VPLTGTDEGRIQGRESPRFAETGLCAGHPKAQCDAALNMAYTITQMRAVGQNALTALRVRFKALVEKMLKEMLARICPGTLTSRQAIKAVLENLRLVGIEQCIGKEIGRFGRWLIDPCNR